MKNYLKFVVAVFGVTIAIFGSINASANVPVANSCDRSMDHCGTTPEGNYISGKYSN